MTPRNYLGSPSEDFLTIIKYLSQEVLGIEFSQIKSIDELLETTLEPETNLFLIDGRMGTAACSEWVQSIRMSLPQTQICVLFGVEAPIDPAILKKNGANQVLHLIYDQEYISETIQNLMINMETSQDVPLSTLNSIATEDLDTELEINFNLFVHLPGNKRTILARRKGAKLDDRFIKKAADTHQTLYVAKKELKSFFEYARTVQSFRNVEKPASITEKFFKTKIMIQEIISVFLNDQITDYQIGKEVLEKCRAIAHEFELLQPVSPKEAYAKMQNFAGRVQSISHDAICTCCYASMLGWILQMPPAQIESLAMAGLLHNIGLAKMPSTTLMKKLSDYTADELKIYQSYPENTVNMVKAKKVAISQDVANAILEHRENADGSGFPKKKMSQDTDDMAKLIRLALRLQSLTSLHPTDPSQKSMLPAQALEFIKTETLEKEAIHDVITITNIMQNIAK